MIEALVNRTNATGGLGEVLFLCSSGLKICVLEDGQAGR